MGRYSRRAAWNEESLKLPYSAVFRRLRGSFSFGARFSPILVVMKTAARKCIFFSLILGFFAVSASGGEAWYRSLDIDAYENLVGRYPVDSDEAESINAYRFLFDDAGRVKSVEYRKTGRALADPRFGVHRIEITYEESFIHRRFTDDRGVPMPDDSGVWAQRLSLDDSGHVIGVFHYDRFGNVIPNRDGVSHRLWELDKFGRRSVERYFAASGARIADGRGVSELHYRWDEAHRLVGLGYFDPEGAPVEAVGEGVHAYRWRRGAYGDALREERFDRFGAPVLAADGSAAVEWDREPRGLAMVERRLGLRNEALADVEGAAVYRYAYDDAGNLVGQTHFDDKDRPTADIAGVVTYSWIHHEQGNELEQLNLDGEGKLTEDEAGMASYRWEYDTRGLMVSSQSFGIDDNPKPDMWGISRYRYVYDESRNLVEASSFADWEILTADASGVAVYRWTYDERGNRITERNYNSDFNPAENSQGIAEYHWVYDIDDRKIEQRQYGLFGQLRADPDGVAVYAWNYDGFGRVSERRHFGIDERPVDDVSGAALARWTYDGEGRPITVARLDRRALTGR